MAINGWFPSINSRGEVASGSGEIFVNDVSFGVGWHPVWVTDDVIVYDGSPTDQFSTYIDARTRVSTPITPGYNAYSGGGGRWAGFFAGAPIHLQKYLGTVADGAAINNAGLPAHAPNGDFCYIDNYTGATHTLYRNGVALIAGVPIVAVSASDAATVWVEATGTYTRAVFGKIGAGAITDWTIEPLINETVVADDAAGDPWVLSVTQTGLILYKGGTASPIYRWSGTYLNPALRFVDGHFHIEASGSDGLRMSLIVSGAGGGGGGVPPTPFPCT